MEDMEKPDLPTINRFITTHDDSGQSIFANSISEKLPWTTIPNGDKFGLAYATDHFPAKLNNDVDIANYQKYLKTPPGLVVPGGTVLRFVDLGPGTTSPMHRTISLDYGVVIEGEVELLLDSGESRLLRRGDVAIQRGTNHAWRNPSKVNAGRMMFVLQESEPLKIGDEHMEEDYGAGMEGVPSSAKR